MAYSTEQIDIVEAEQICFDFYNIKGKAKKLPGEIDFNFRIKSEDGELFILKISRSDYDVNYLNYQQDLLRYVNTKNPSLNAPNVILDTNEKALSTYEDSYGKIRQVRLLSWVAGRVWNDVNPQTDNLRTKLGSHCGELTKTLTHFEHANAAFKFDWDIAQSLWTKKYIHLFKEEELDIILHFQNLFESDLNSYQNLRKQIVHNDANYDNVIVSKNILDPEINGVIDYGDAIHTQTINDLAIICAYGIIGYPNPLQAALPIVTGYHQSFPLLEGELEHLYNGIAMRLVISVTKSAINKQKEPDNVYLQRSEKGAWDLLKKWKENSSEFAQYSFRKACNFSSHPNEIVFNNWAKSQEFSMTDLFPKINKTSILPIDLSVSSSFIGHQDEVNDLLFYEYKFSQLQSTEPDKIIAGGYLEPRPVYSSSHYDTYGNYGNETRTIHLGIDFWVPATSEVYALLDGEVVMAANDSEKQGYGGFVIVKHLEDSIEFYTLYGHLSVASALNHSIGDHIKKGSKIGEIGTFIENGNWIPHLHFQIMLSLLDFTDDFPGVAYHSEIAIWKSLSPNPNLFFQIPELEEQNRITNHEILSYRKEHLGKSLSLQYETPIQMVRGQGVYLIDQYGKKYIDTVNNVAHVGHEHPQVIQSGQQQMGILNTNSRYLHPNINALAKEILETLPPELSVVHFVNSGSEANELALRMVKSVNGQKDIIASEIGYHGNTNGCIAISSYKFDSNGGSGCPEHTHIFPLPDTFRGKYRGENSGKQYANEVLQLIKKIKKLGREVGGFILEPIISCGGQVPLPKGFLKEAYKMVRNAGGICISDEVQVGCGRLGKTFWGFQLHDVIPDIVTIGKPLGNGHPLAAVVCTKEIAEKFANGMEYFNTFGGNPVSCAIGASVLRTVKKEKLQQNALNIGNYLKLELQKLTEDFPIIGDIRGEGLFLGVELVDSNFNPLADQTSYLANRMKDFGVLMSTDGPDHNVLKIKPPLVFSKENANYLLTHLIKVFKEDYMQIQI